MRNLLNPKWLLIINTLPVAVLLFIFKGQYDIIHSLLNGEEISVWINFGLALAFLGILNLVYILFLISKKQTVHVLYGVTALLTYIPFIYVYSLHLEDLLPFTIPRWMVPGDLVLYVGTFLMPTLIYALLVLVTYFTPEEKTNKAWKSFVFAAIVPLSWYIFSQVILPLWRPMDYGFSIHAFLILFIAGTLLFLFFLIRGVFILANTKSERFQKYQFVWKIPITLVFPILGLAANSGHLFEPGGIGDSGIFGDFSSLWFYLLAVINGVLLCLPDFENKIYRLVLFIGRTITFAYTLYFFLVFLPFLPLSVLAIIAFGIGFLMLTPLALFFIHIHQLSKDFIFLKQFFTKNVIRGIYLLSFLIIPIIITIQFQHHKKVLHETLDYLYNPDYSKNYTVDESSLAETIAVVKSHKARNNDFIFNRHIPYISSYFNWIVLDNLTLSNSKVNTIESIFFGEYFYGDRYLNNADEDLEITKINTTSTYDKSQEAWSTWVDFEITNSSPNDWFTEYATTFDLPAGCWISNYYLFVGDKKEMGILAEKKSAMWVFNSIRNENRDPGILYYLTGNKVAFTVFPFSQGEVRKTGIEFLHKEPLTLNIDSNVVQLGDTSLHIPTKGFEDENMIYVSANEKQKLKTVQRKPYFHFLINASADMNTHQDDFIERIDRLTAVHSDLAENAKISYVNAYVTTEPLNQDWKDHYKAQKFKGGFYIDRAIRKELVNSYKSKGDTYPIFVVVTDDIYNAVIHKNFADLKMTFPESDLFFNLTETGNLKPHSLVSSPYFQNEDSLNYSFENKVLEYRMADNSVHYLRNDSQPEIILKKDNFTVSETGIKEHNWQSALTMQGKWISQILHPETANDEWLNLVKYSFQSKVMSPVTSYLVVENEAQKEMLKRKQEQVLAGKKDLDLDDDTQNMSEPGFFVLAILLVIFLWYREKRKRVVIK